MSPSARALQRRPVARLIVRQKLALEARHVHAHRALGLAGAALQAQVEHLVDALIAQPGLAQVCPSSPGAARWRGRASNPLPRASPCRTDTWCRRVSCGTPRRRCTFRPRRRCRRIPNNRKTCSGSASGSPAPKRRFDVSGGESTILPGLKMPCGSKVRLISRNASYSVSPNICRMNGPRTRPSPCSPESAPPNSSTRSATSFAIASNLAHALFGLHVDHRPHVQASHRSVRVNARRGSVPAHDVPRTGRCTRSVFPARPPCLRRTRSTWRLPSSPSKAPARLRAGSRCEPALTGSVSV